MHIKPTNDSWYFYHRISKKKLGPFSMVALCHLMIESGIKLDQILVAKPGWTEWKNPMMVAEFLANFQKAVQSKDNLLPPIDEEHLPAIDHNDQDKTKTNVIHIASKKQEMTEVSSVSTKLENKIESRIESKIEISKQKTPLSQVNNDEEEESHWISKRKHPRFKIELKVVIISQDKTFRTKTKDLSLGGMKTYDALPEHFTKNPVDVFISSPDFKISIKFTAEVVSDKKTHCHIKFIENSQHSIKELETWLSQLESKQNSTSTKKAA